MSELDAKDREELKDSQEFVQLKAEADRQLAAWSALKQGQVAALERGR